MVFYTAPFQRLPTPVTPPAKDRHVLGVNRIGDRRQRDDKGKDGRSLRHRLIDLVMDEVDGLPDLTSPQKQRIRHNLGRFSDRQPDHPSGHPPPPPPTPEQALAALTEHDADGAVPPPSGDVDPAALTQQMQQLLSLHNERATKIANYIHAMMAITQDSHQVSLDI